MKKVDKVASGQGMEVGLREVRERGGVDRIKIYAWNKEMKQ